MSESTPKSTSNDKTAKFPFLVLAVSILLTVGITYIFYQSARSKDAIRFNNEVNRLQTTIESRLNLYVALLNGGRGFVESNPVISRQTFAEYVGSLNLGRNYAGVQGIGYAKVVTGGERAALAARMKSEGFADFQILPVAEKDFYRTTLYFEPLSEANRGVIGFDLGSEIRRGETLDRARDTGAVATSPKISLLQPAAATPSLTAADEPGFLICLPIYKNRQLPATVEERRKNVAGFIYSPFRSRDFLREVQDGATDVALRIYDGAPDAENLLAQTIEPAGAAFPNQFDEAYAAEKEIQAAGRKWIVRYQSLPAFAAQSSLGWSPLIFIIGTIFSFLLFGMTYWEAAARLKLQAAAADLQTAERQKQGLLEKEQAARQSAEQANKTKDEFIAVVSHELRTPLNAIAGWTRILRTEELSGNTKNLALEKIDKNLRLQTKLVEDLLDYSQIVSGTIQMAGKAVDFSEAFERAFNEVEPAAREKNIEFVKDNQTNGAVVTGDADKIRLVIENLLVNAVKFTAAGGRVEVVAHAADDTVRMIVRDNGKGISREFLPHVFDRFRQADTSSTRINGGLGLGLTISNHIVKMHRGSIEADSAGDGKGATFTLTLPKHSPAVEATS